MRRRRRAKTRRLRTDQRSIPKQVSVTAPLPTAELIRREWARNSNAGVIAKIAASIENMTRAEIQLFEAGLALEEGDLPWIGQYGFAHFEKQIVDHRVINTNSGDEHAKRSSTGETQQSRETSVGSRSSTRRTASAASQTGSRSSPRRRVYRSIAEVIAEDSSPLHRYFPQFSPPLWDPQLKWWYREGWLWPLRTQPARFSARLCYEDDLYALPVVRILPDPVPQAPHVWKHVRNGLEFRSLCYTFAPDGSVVRGRGDDVAAEALRQCVVWLIRYSVWLRFSFWPGEDVGHDAETIERNTRPGDPCPVHPGRIYETCCRPAVLQGVRKVRTA